MCLFQWLMNNIKNSSGNCIHCTASGACDVGQQTETHKTLVLWPALLLIPLDRVKFGITFCFYLNNCIIPCVCVKKGKIDIDNNCAIH